jgi:hypothetical protein
MGRDPDLSPLRDRVDFRRLQASLLDRAFPVDLTSDNKRYVSDMIIGVRLQQLCGSRRRRKPSVPSTDGQPGRIRNDERADLEAGADDQIGKYQKLLTPLVPELPL